jgi:hypothetical protein
MFQFIIRDTLKGLPDLGILELRGLHYAKWVGIRLYLLKSTANKNNSIFPLTQHCTL